MDSVIKSLLEAIENLTDLLTNTHEHYDAKVRDLENANREQAQEIVALKQELKGLGVEYVGR